MPSRPRKSISPRFSPGGAAVNSQACKRLGSAASHPFVAFSPVGAAVPSPLRGWDGGMGGLLPPGVYTPGY